MFDRLARLIYNECMKQALPIVIVAVLALVIGYFALTKQPSQPQQVGNVTSTSTPSSPNDVASDQISKLTRDQAYAAFSVREKEARSHDGLTDFIAAVQTLATSTPNSTMSFDGCEPMPKVLLAQKDGALKFKNAGTTTIAIRANSKFNYSIDGGKTVDASAAIKGVTGFISLSCNGRGPVGAVSIAR